MRPPTTRGLEWWAASYTKGNDTVWISLQGNGDRARCYSIEGNTFRTILDTLKKQGFRKKTKEVRRDDSI